MTMPSSAPGPAQRGQVIVIAALAITALLTALALVIDGGNAYAQQRQTQNGTDAAAEAGATQLARWIVGVAITDTDVETAVDLTSAANGITSVDSAEYTDRYGAVLGTVGAGSIRGHPGGEGRRQSRVQHLHRGGRRHADLDRERGSDRDHGLRREVRVRWGDPADPSDPADPVRNR